MKYYIIKILIIFIMSEYCFCEDYNNFSFFFKNYTKISGFSELLKTRYKNIKSNENYFQVPAKNSLLTILYPCDEENDSKRVYEQVDIRTTQVVFCKTSEKYDPIIVEEIFKNIDIPIKNPDIDSKLTFRIDINDEVQNNSEYYFLIAKIKERLISKKICLVDRLYIQEFVDIQDNYLGESKGVVIISNYIINISKNAKIIVLNINNGISGTLELTKTFENNFTLNELADTITDYICNTENINLLRNKI
ncbi:MAG: hypothetical protein ACD_79C01331G0002 [uncultured bacterium]|nr:MAG: hypothetical protein ACD_79C01331G0002 [uncultured bacterium]